MSVVSEGRLAVPLLTRMNTARPLLQPEMIYFVPSLRSVYLSLSHTSPHKEKAPTLVGASQEITAVA